MPRLSEDQQTALAQAKRPAASSAGPAESKTRPATQVVGGKTSMLHHALALAEDGWRVFPLRPGGKEPLFGSPHKRGYLAPSGGKCRGECGKDGHGAWDGTTDPDKIRRWWGQNPKANIGISMGEDRIAVDIDPHHGGTRPAVLPPTRTHASGRGSGEHLIYRVVPGSAAARLQQNNTGRAGDGVDIKIGGGAYLVAPPSLHPDTGQPYTVSDERDPAPLTDETIGAWLGEDAVAVRPGGVPAGGLATVTPITGGGTRKDKGAVSLLARLLQNPPARGEGKANDWLTQVAGHYAKRFRDMQDLYVTQCKLANLMLRPPFDEAEFLKTVDSIWRTEHEGHPERGCTEETGWLTGNGHRLQCRVARKDGDDTVYDLDAYADFDIVARGVDVSDESTRRYWVELHWNGQVIASTVDGDVLGDDRNLRKWLAARGASIDPPMNANPKTPPGTRILRYLNSQKPDEIKIVSVLGWDEDQAAFVTLDGVITADGPASREECAIVADPDLAKRDVVPYAYGFTKDWGEAQRVLSEVLSFQDETLTSVFGAWWASCLLKPQMEAKTALFPFMAVEAPSESGKTNGFFAQMVQLNGNTRGETVPTRPVLRDSAAAHRSGIVWADDLDDVMTFGELLRASTSGGTSAKMGEDRTSIKSTQIVAPMLVTGEGLGLGNQKALLDRAVILSASSPKGRMSRHDKTRRQWDDVLALQDQYPEANGGLSVLAGWYVQAALAQEANVLKVLSAAAKQGARSGRSGDKDAILVAGACLLDSMTGWATPWEMNGPHASRVADWVANQGRNGVHEKDNTLTLQILPWAIRTFKYPTDAEEATGNGRFGDLDSPVFVREPGERDDDLMDQRGTDHGEVWFSAALLAQAWAREHNGRISTRTDTETALRDQAIALGAKAVRRRVKNTRRRAYYFQLDGQIAGLVLRRASGAV